MNHLAARSVVVVATVVGAASLFAFAVFLFAGPIVFVDLGLDDVSRLVSDGLVCLGFFIPHSGMIRKSFRERLARLVPELYHGAIYTIVSGTTLLAMVAFWQPSGWTLLSLEGGLRVLARVFYIAAVIGFGYTVRSLRSFDAFGLRPVRAHIRGKPLTVGPLALDGAYRWVRHPLYFFTLLMIWSFPDLTADRILFNVLWTGWIVGGTWLEERDLVAQFGDAYRKYQQRVPMLMPLGPPMPKEGVSPSNPDTD